MAIVSLTPETLKETRIYQLLQQCEGNEDVLSRTSSFIETVSPQLDLVLSGPFKEYTLHNKVHSIKIVHLIPYLITEQTLSAFGPLELQLIVFAAFFHDLGMSLTSTEMERIIESTDFTDSLRAWPALWKDIQACRSALAKGPIEGERQKLELLQAQLINAGIANYIRPRHADPERYKELITSLCRSAGRDDLFTYRGISFADYLIDICVSHNLPVSELLKTRDLYDPKYPDDALVAGERINVRFLACLLRLADILDFDRERTPKILLESLGIEARTMPGSELTLQEWNKHLSVHTIDISQDEIVFAGTSKHPIVEKAIRDFCSTIEREIRDTTAVLKRCPAPVTDKYQIDLPLCVRPRIISDGYTFRDFSLTLNQSAIATLLMGERLTLPR